MKITVLGTRGEIPETLPYHSKHTGILVDDVLLIDVGEKGFLRLNPQWILISHFHPDHAYFMRRGKMEILPQDIPIYAPEKPSGISNNNVIVLDKETKIGPYTVRPIPTHHSKHVKSFAYVIKKDNCSFFYTGDLVWIDKKYRSFLHKVDLVITEGSFIQEGGLIRKDAQSGKLFGHQGIPNLIKLLKPFSDTILFIHFGSWFYKSVRDARKKFKLLGKKNALSVIVGYDGLVVNVNHSDNDI